MVETELKLMYKDITEEKTKVMFMWYGQELKIDCKNLIIKNCETDEIMTVSENYNVLFKHCENILIKLLDLLDVDLFDAWDIYYNQENFSTMGNWEEWENVESIEDLNLKVKKYDTTKKGVEDFMEKNRPKQTFI